MSQDKIVVHGARVHNLKNITVSLPRDRFVVITGLSGSGKSSLAFDTIYAEGQRRYVESLSAYARQFLGQMDKPDVDQIEGLSPAISIDQKGVSHNPRSTVGTVTEIYDYLRLLYARAGTPHCWNCGRAISQQTVSQMVDQILSRPAGTRFMVLAPLIRDRKGHHKRVFDEVRRLGYVRVRVNGEIRDVSEDIELDRYKMHTIEVVVDRLIVPGERRGEAYESFVTRLADSLETALDLSAGIVVVQIVDGEELLFSEQFACVYCSISVGEIEPRTFSFNSPHGACPTCQGLGTKMEIDPDLVIPNKELSLNQGALVPWGGKTASPDTYYLQLVRAAARHFSFSMEAHVRELPERAVQILLYGAPDETITVHYRNRHGRERAYETTFPGVIPNLERRYRETTSDYMRQEIERFMAHRPCPDCGGARLKKESLAVLLGGRNIHEVSQMSVAEALTWIEQAPARMGERQRAIARQVSKEIHGRLSFLADVGLDYLTLQRTATTLSGGEAQRIRLATQIGSQLMGVLYILDEPSIGLHQRDNARLIRTLKRMRDLGNTVIVVEHDEETIRAADWVIDLGPGAGEHGGRVIAQGPPQAIEADRDSITGDYLAGRRRIAVPAQRRKGKGESLVLRGAAEHNLKGIDVEFPLGKFIGVTGVSGSGKSTLVVDVLYTRLAQILHQAREKPGRHQALEGAQHVDKVINIDQSPIGRTPRSNPGTYTNVFTHIRELFAQLPDARMRGYKPGRFSFNIKGGRCEACQGDGIIKIEMQFLPDVYVPCEVCRGQRYNRETLQVRYKGKNIHEVLEMTVEEAMRFFENIPAIKRKLKTLYDVGLGYIRLGQPAPTLSGGEAQRVKLSRELSKRPTGRTLYILDEPTTGLHFEDCKKLLRVLDRLVSGGNTVIVIEHNLDVIKCADWIIDLGPEGGEAGGRVITQGTPEEVAAMPHSYTGQFLARVLNGASALPLAQDEPEEELQPAG